MTTTLLRCCDWQADCNQVKGGSLVRTASNCIPAEREVASLATSVKKFLVGTSFTLARLKANDSEQIYNVGSPSTPPYLLTRDVTAVLSNTY